MPRWDGPSNADLVYEVLRTAERPLTFAEIFDEVNRRRPVTTKNPRATIRNVLSQGRQLVGLGDGRYGYLPHLVRGSLLRLPLTEKKPADRPLVYPDEIRHALWPSFLEIQKRTDRRPAHARLPNGEEVELPLTFLGTSVWGSPPPEPLRRYLARNKAAAGDALLVRVLDGEAGRCEVWLESKRQRDEARVAARNRELADAAYPIVRRAPSYGMPIWDLVTALLARGFYRSEVAPDPLEKVLPTDPRFVEAGFEMWLPAEAVTPEMAAWIRERKEREDDFFPLKTEAPAGPPDLPSPMALRGTLERALADIGAALSEQEFGSIEEANAFLQEMLAGGGLPRRRAETALDRAQDLAYAAWEAPSSGERVRLARKALETSPDCADAYVLLAEETARNAQEALDLYARGVAAGERALGKRAFKEDVGHFWGLIETRPYMRARLGLAQALWALGRRDEAIGHARQMLRLNPGDNQGIRYLLLSWFLEIGDDARVGELLDEYPDDAAAQWLYARALHAFRAEGDTPRARRLRAEAQRWNPHVSDYLLGKKRLPRALPAMTGIGDESEAVYCAAEQLTAWRRTPGALDWLRGSAPTQPAHA